MKQKTNLFCRLLGIICVAVSTVVMAIVLFFKHWFDHDSSPIHEMQLQNAERHYTDNH